MQDTGRDDTGGVPSSDDTDGATSPDQPGATASPHDSRDDLSAGLAVLIRLLLGVGVILVLGAGVLGVLKEGRLPTAAVSIGALPLGLVTLDAAAWGTLGVLVFLATPPTAVAYLGVTFHRRGDRVFALVAGAVFALVMSGLAMAWLAHPAPMETYLPHLEVLPEAGVLVAGALAGSLGVTLGLGGGVFVVPILSVFFGVPLKLAIAASAISVVVNSLGGTSAYLKDRMTNVRLALVMEMSTAFGAVIGGLIVVAIAPDVLRGVFGVSLVALALVMLLRPREVGSLDTGPDRLKLRRVFRDGAAGTDVAYIPQRIPFGLTLSSLAGVLSGMLGIGGGVVKMPLLHAVMRVPVKAAAATSVFMVGITVSASAYVYYVHDLVDLSVAVPAVLGIQIGSRLGAVVARRTHSTTVVRLLVVILVYLGAVLILQAFGVHVPGSTGR
ncbi:MAG: DUF1634 domain-containing protein [Gemmatimonadetes bacterium]|nr:DUF1634 domain-containing protein [Gemmatimonadota bacterium]